MPTLKVDGARELQALARKMRLAGQGGLKNEMFKALRAEVKPVIDEQKSTVRGLSGAPSEWRRAAAGATRAKVQGGGRRVGVKITVSRKGDAKYARILNRGTWRHPYFNLRRARWYRQNVQPGWFDAPATKAAPKAQRRMMIVLGKYLNKVGR